MPIDELMPHLQWHLEQQGINLANGPKIESLIPEFAERAQTLKDLVTAVTTYYKDFENFEVKAAKKHLRPVAKAALQLVQTKLKALTEWTPVQIQTAVDQTAQELEIGMGKVGMPLRVAATGGGMSPAIDMTLDWIGQERVIQRIDMALAFIAEREAQS